MRLLLLTTALAALSATPAFAEDFQGISIGAEYYDIDAAASFPDLDPNFMILNEQNDLSLGGAGFSLGYTQRVSGPFYLGGRISFVSADQSGHIDELFSGVNRDYTLNSISTVELRAGYAFDTPFGGVMPYGFVGVLSRDISITQSCPPSGFFLNACSPGGGLAGYNRSGQIEDSAPLFGAGVEWAPNPWGSIDLRFGHASFDEESVSLGVDGQNPPQALSVPFGEQDYSFIAIGVRIRYDLLSRF